MTAPLAGLPTTPAAHAADVNRLGLLPMFAAYFGPESADAAFHGIRLGISLVGEAGAEAPCALARAALLGRVSRPRRMA